MSGGGERVRPARRTVTYCIVPGDLAGKLHEPLNRHFRDDASVEVIVERRAAERRETPERRTDEAAAPDEERRRIRRTGGRRVAEQRAAIVQVDARPLPRKARAYRGRLVFVERLEPLGQAAEDEDTERLVTRIQGGDTEQFTVLYQRYFKRVYAYMRVVFRDEQESEDATQQVFLHVFEALPRYRRRAQPFRGWLFVIARNHALNQLKLSKRSELVDIANVRQAADAHELSAEDLSALDWVSDRELHLFIERLPLAQRQVLFLRYVFGFSTSEAASILGESTDAVRKQNSRALKFLRDRLTALGRAPTGRRSSAVEPVLRKAVVLRRRRFALIARR